MPGICHVSGQTSGWTAVASVAQTEYDGTIRSCAAASFLCRATAGGLSSELVSALIVQFLLAN
jgi:hypothetical protein